LNSDVTGNVIQFPTATATSGNVQKMEELEAHAIENAIVQYKGNLTEAAKALGIGRATLYRKVKQYHIDPSAARKKKVAA
jgi:DNA-binding NtrC family response regulator